MIELAVIMAGSAVSMLFGFCIGSAMGYVQGQEDAFGQCGPQPATRCPDCRSYLDVDEDECAICGRQFA